MKTDYRGYTIDTTEDDERFAFVVRRSDGARIAHGKKWSGHRSEDAAVRNAQRVIRGDLARVKRDLHEARERLRTLEAIVEKTPADADDIADANATVRRLRDIIEAAEADDIEDTDAA